jgi:DNA-binding LacI/PurR family transcriptional regulator
MAKYSRIAAMVAQQVERGDYRLRRFPSISQLAKELKFNPRTITKAVDELVQQGILHRDTTGRVTISKRVHAWGMHVALLHPAFVSPLYTRAQEEVQRLTDARGWQLKPIVYTHWYDPVINDALNGFDGVFFIPPSEDIPDDLVQMMKGASNPLVVLDQDVSARGIPSVQFNVPSSSAAVLDTLLEAGHRRMVCISTQPNDPIIRERIDQWTLWTRMNKVDGRLVDRHVRPNENALECAYITVSQLLEKGDLPETAMFCTTGAAAVGAMRALIDHGRQPGRDIAVCAADDDAGRAQFMSPRLTCLQDPDWSPYLEICLDWFGGGDWVGPRLLHPHRMTVFTGESTSLYQPAERSD